MKRILVILFSFLTILMWRTNCVFASGMPYLGVSGGDRIVVEGEVVESNKIDTVWTLLRDLNHQDLDALLETEKTRGVCVLFACVLLDACDENYYHDKALRDCNIVRPYMTNGSDFEDVVQYDYWDNVCYVLERCERYGLYVVLLPLGSDVYEKSSPSRAMVRIYMNLLCQKVRQFRNVGWITRRGDMLMEDVVRQEIVESIRVHNKKQPILY